MELTTGLFPDAETVDASITTREGTDRVVRLDLSSPSPDDIEIWEAAAAAILDADLIVTL